MYKILYLKEKKAVKRLKRFLQRESAKVIRYRRMYKAAKMEAIRSKKATAELNDYVVEWCTYCERQVTMLWNLEEDGLVAFCPHCGARMMLCENCHGKCDYSENTDTCKEM